MATSIVMVAALVVSGALVAFGSMLVGWSIKTVIDTLNDRMAK